MPAPLKRAVIAQMIEAWVNEPGLGVEEIGRRFNISSQSVSRLISQHWLYKIPTVGTMVVVRQSAINEELKLMSA